MSLVLFLLLQYIYLLISTGISTISQIIPDTCEAIYQVLKDDYLTVPSTSEEWLDIAKGFSELWNFPNCIGAIDGKHIVMRKPHHAGSMYHNYKGQESIVLMAIVDAQQRLVVHRRNVIAC